MKDKLKRFLSLLLVFVMVLSTVPANAEEPIVVVNDEPTIEAPVEEVAEVAEPACTHEETVTVASVEATCTTAGLTEGVKCSVCGEMLAAQEELPVVEHAYAEDGVCSVCGTAKPVEEPAAELTSSLESTGRADEENVYVAKIERTGNSYTLLEVAFAEAADGDTIILLNNVKEEVVRLSVSDAAPVKGLTLNLNGKTWDCGYGTRINAVNLTITGGGIIGTARKVAQESGESVDVFYFGGHATLPSTLIISDSNVTFNAELRVNNMAPSDEELGLLATARTTEAPNVTKVTINGGQFDVVTVQKKAYLTINGGRFSGINEEEGAHVEDNRHKNEGTEDSGDSEATPEIVTKKEVYIKTLEEYGYACTESGVTLTFVDVTPISEGQDFMEFTVGASSTDITAQIQNNDESWTTVEPVRLSTFQHKFTEPGSVTYRIDWDNNGTYDRLVVLVKAEAVAQNTTTGKYYADLHLALEECKKGETVILLDDVDLEGVEWEPIGGYNGANHFQGTFDGQGYTIKNLTVTKTDAGSAKTRLALFSAIKNATITNLTIDNAQITANGSDTRGAVLVMTEEGANSITNITITNSTVDVQSGANGYATGVLGYSDGNIQMSNITVSGLNLNVKATETARAAAVVAYLGQGDSDVSSLDNFNISDVEITASAPTTYVGGAMGYIQKGNQNAVGIGLTNGTVSGLTIKSNATSAGNVGGLIGMSYKVDPQKVADVTITGLDIDFSGSGSKVGGVIGWDQSVSYNNATKKGWYNNVHVSGTINENITSGSGSEVGGFVGVSHYYPKIYTNCSADVTIVTGNRAGGFVGTPCPNGWNSQTDSYIDCSASGNVTAPVAGGFVGCAWLNNGVNTTLLLERVTATGEVKGSTHAGGLIGYAGGTGGCSNIIIKDSTASMVVVGPNPGNTAGVVGNSGMASGKFIVLDNVTWTVEPPINPASAAKIYVAQVGEDKFFTLAEAVAKANDIEGGATVELLADVELGEKLTISGDVTIEGAYTITRADDYTDTLFAVNAGAKLTLDGGLTIDGGNEWIFDEAGYKAALADSSKHQDFAFVTSEEGAPVAAADLFIVNGAMVVNDATIQNHMGNSNCNVFGLNSNAALTLNDGAKIAHNATSFESAVVAMSAGSTFTINEGAEISGNYAGRNGGVSRNNNGTIVMNGGEIINNYSVNTNGTVFMLYGADSMFEMNDGLICGNTGTNGPHNGRNAVIYGHTGSKMVMNGGSICHNTGTSYGGIDAPYTGEAGNASRFEIKGGYVGENVSILGYANADVNGGERLIITGGTYTQDVFQWLAPDHGLIHDEEAGTYTVTKHVYNLYFRDPATGEQVPGVGPLQGNDPASLVATGKAFYANYYDMELEVLCNAKIDDPIVVDYPLTINLNGKTITGVDVYPMVRVQGGANVTVKGGTMTNDDYVFVLGASDGSSAGNLTIESGSYTGVTTVASVTKGTLTITGGEFKVTESADGTTYLLNCIDANYKDGSAKIEVKGGTFYGFNPEDNAAENPKANFVAKGYKSTDNGNGSWTVEPNMIFEMHLVNANGEAHWLSPMSGNDLNGIIETSKIWYDSLQGTYSFTLKILENCEIDETVQVTFPMTIDLNGKTITTAATAAGEYKDAFTILANVTVTGNGTIDARPSHGYTFYVGDKNGNAGNLTIVNGNFYGETSVVNNRLGTVSIQGGSYKVSLENEGDTYDYVLNCIDDNYKNGTAKIAVTGGTFHNFNPEDNAAEGANTNFCAQNYYAEEVESNVFVVKDYVAWVKAQLLAGNNVTLDRDIVITDYSYVNALKLPSNGNGKYTEVHGNGAVFHVIKPGVVLDLNGHSITWNAHDDAYCNNRQVSLFMVTVTGNPGEDSSLSVKDSIGNANVNVYGMGTGMYVVCAGAQANINGGTWTNYPCTDCGASNIFLYPSHGGTLNISAGIFQQKESEYLLGWKGSSKETTDNGVGVDYDETKVSITGGTFVGFNPEETKFFDTANSGQETINGVAEGYKAVNIDDEKWVVKPLITVEFADVTIVEGDELPEFTYTTNFTEVADDGEMLVVEEPEVTVNGVGEYDITANAYVFMNNDYAVEVIPGTLTVLKAVAEVNGTKYAFVQEAIDAADAGDIVTVLDNVTEANIKVAADDNIVLELNGKTLTGDILSEGTLVVKNGTIINTDSKVSAIESKNNLTVTDVNIVSARHALRIDGGVAVINGGSFRVTGTADTTTHAVNASSAATVTINGGTFVGPKGTSSDSGAAINVQENTTVNVTAGNFSGGKNNTLAVAGTLSLTGGTYDQDPAAYVADGYKAVDNEDNTWTVKPLITVTFADVIMVEGNEMPKFTYTTNFTEVAEDGLMLVVEEPEVTVNGVGEYEITADAYVFMSDKYEVEVIPGKLTVQKAVAVVKEIQDGNEVKYYYATLQEPASLGKTFSLLCDVELTETLVFETAGAYMKLEGHSITGELETLIHVKANGTVNINGNAKTNLQNTGDVVFVESGNLSIYGEVTLTSAKANCIYVRGGNTTVQKATLIAKGDYPAIQGNGNYAGNVSLYETNVTKAGVTSSNDIAIYWPNNGNLTINGGVITGKTAVYAKSGKITINGGTFNGNGDAADFSPNNNGATATGDAVVIEASSNPAYEKPTVSITGGTFKSVNALAVATYGEGMDGVKFITGGVFSSDPTDLCVDGYMGVKQADDMWIVKKYIEVTLEDAEMFIGDAVPEAKIADIDWKLVEENDVNVIVTEGTSAAVDADGTEVEITEAGEYFITAAVTAGDYAVVVKPGKLTAKVAVAKIDDVKYATLTEAVEDVQIGETIELLAEVAVGGWDGTLVVEGKDFIIDLNDNNLNLNTIGGTIPQAIKVASTLTITGNGNVNVSKQLGIGACVGFRVEEGGKLILNGGNYIAATDCNVATVNGTIEISDGVYTANDKPIFNVSNFYDGSAVVTGGTFKSAAFNGDANDGAIAIYGGCFVNEVPENWCAEGYIPVKCPEDCPYVGTYTVKLGKYVAQIINAEGNVIGKYETLTEAVKAVQNGETIEFLTDIDDDVTITQQKDLSFTIDGANNDYTGTMTLNGGNRSSGKETLTIQNVNFVADNYGQSSITTVKNTYVHNVTVDHCTFDATGDAVKATYGIYLSHAYNINVTNVTGKNLFDLVYGNNAVTGFTAENVTVTDSVQGIWLAYVNSTASFKNLNIEASSVGVGFVSNTAGTATFEECTITAGEYAVGVSENASKKVVTLIFKANNNLGENWLGIAGTGADVKVDLTESDLDIKKVSYDETYYVTKPTETDKVWLITKGEFVAQIIDAEGNVIGKYETLNEAVEAVQNGETIVLLADSADDIEVNGNISLDVGVYSYTGTVTLTDAAATLTAVEGLNVTTDVAGSGVLYENEVYKVVLMIKFATFQLEFASQNTLRMYFEVPDEVLAIEGVKAVVTEENNKVKPNQTVDTYILSECATDSKGRYYFDRAIASGEMTGDVMVEFFDGADNRIHVLDKDGVIKPYVIRRAVDYAQALVSNAKLNPILSAMLTYGGYAQINFGVDTENLAYNTPGFAPMDISGVTAATINQVLSATGDSIGIQYSGQRVNMDAYVYMRTYFTLDAGASIDNYEFKLTYTEGGSEKIGTLTAKLDDDGRYYVDILNIPVAYWDYMYKITVTDNATGGTYEVTSSVLSWAQRVIESASQPEKTKNMAKAMYLYNQAANEYFGK